MSQDYNVEWQEVWEKKTKKIISFLWSLCCKTIAVNTWRVKYVRKHM